jgi:D-arabinose 1-dehydrogenase-like Zn-dependent alcohol dehydrogenase
MRSWLSRRISRRIFSSDGFSGELPHIHYPIVPGHEIVGIVEALGPSPGTLTIGQRVGIPWLGRTCGHCEYCMSDRENLCDAPTFTGDDRDGGFVDDLRTGCIQGADVLVMR